MPTQSNNSNLEKEKGEKMVLKSFYVEPSIWKEAQRKSGLIPLAAVIRKLLHLWINGKINLDNYDD